MYRVGGLLLKPLPWAVLLSLVLFGFVLIGALSTDETRLPNDHFLWIARARQMLGGDLPFKDFVDEGWLLQYCVSALAQALWTKNLYGEIIVDSLFISAGVVLTFHLTSTTTKSILLGFAATTLLVLLPVRLYNYPKVFLYPFALLLLWHYIDAPSTRRSWGLAFFTALAFLFRHDHGALIGATAAFGIMLTHRQSWRQAALRVGSYAIATWAILIPYWIYISMNGGLISYFSSGIEMSQHDSRNALFAAAPPFIVRLGSSLTGAVYHPANSVPWLYWSFYVWPLVGLLLVGIEFLRGRRGLAVTTSLERIKLASAAVLSGLACLWLLRSPVTARLPDVAAVSVICGSGVLSLWWRMAGVPLTREALRSEFARASSVGSLQFGRRLKVSLRIMAATFAALMAVVTWHSAFAPPGQSVMRNPVWHGPDAAIKAISAGVNYPHATSSRAGPVGTYVGECTKPTDRVMFGWFVSEYPVYVNRLFAGGQTNWYQGFSSSTPAQKLTIQRLMAQSVPIIIISPQYSAARGSFAGDYPLIAAYLEQRYEIREWPPFRVLTDKNIAPTGVYRESNLPCYS